MSQNVELSLNFSFFPTHPSPFIYWIAVCSASNTYSEFIHFFQPFIALWCLSNKLRRKVQIPYPGSTPLPTSQISSPDTVSLDPTSIWTFMLSSNSAIAFPPQGLCTGLSLCLEWLTTWLVSAIQILIQMSLLQRSGLWSPSLPQTQLFSITLSLPFFFFCNSPNTTVGLPLWLGW